MDHRFRLLAAAAAEKHGVFTTSTARYHGVTDSLRNKWLEQGKIERLGRHTFCFAGLPRTWHSRLAAKQGDHGRGALIAGRSSAALHHFDGFVGGPAELWVPRSNRNRVRDDL